MPHATPLPQSVGRFREVDLACKKHLAGRELNEDQRQRINVVAEALERFIAKDASLDSFPATDLGGEQEDKASERRCCRNPRMQEGRALAAIKVMCRF